MEKNEKKKDKKIYEKKNNDKKVNVDEKDTKTVGKVKKKRKILSKKKNNNKLSKEEVKKVKKQLKSVKTEAKATYKPVSFSLIEVIVIILITGVVVSVCSGLIVFNNYDKFISNDNDERGKLNEFIESYNHILESYVEDIDSEKLLDAAISAMYNYLGDSYSGYIDKETSEDLQEQLNGKYKGVGIEITSDGENVIVTDVFKDTSAERAGIKAGDIIVKIDGEDYRGKDASSVSNAIKKSDKKTFLITYIRDGKEYTTKLEKEEVYINSVESDVIDGIGYILIETFSATTMEQVKDKLDGFDDKVKSIVVDVRSNSGGYLSSAYNTADLFIEKGKMIYKLKDKDGNITNYLDKNEVYRKFDKIVVLINEGSASASEILAAALKESADAKLVGKTSFGKGTVQDTEVLSSGAMVKYTSSYWLTPNGNNINNIGLAPDIKVVNDDKEKDTQLEKAIEVAK